MSKIDPINIQKEFHTPLHVIRHMQAVCKVATKIAEKLQQQGLNIDIDLIKKAALVHDAVRVCDFREFEPEKFQQKVSEEDIKIWQELRLKYKKIGHAKALARILEKREEHALANLVEKHDFNQIDKLETWEEKIIYYADKRVNGEQITTLKDRLQKGYERNKDKDLETENREGTLTKIFQLEEEIKQALGGKLPI